jgi:kynurenine formamidase
MLLIAGPALADKTIIDLTHAYDADTVYWPTATGFEVIALPMKIKGGSGGPLRIVAVLP